MQFYCENISESPSFPFHYLLEVVEISMILCAIIIKVRRRYLGIHTPSINPPDSVSYYIGHGHININHAKVDQHASLLPTQ
jgi:hypothetical protein